MNSNYLPVFDIKIESAEKKYVNTCLKKSSIGQGMFIKKFEHKFNKFLGSKFSITCSSGTAALHLACLAIGIKKGDEVLVSTSTNMASAFSIIYCGAKPIPIDVSRDSWQMDTTQIEKQINKKTKAIMVVHLFGQSVDMDKVIKIAKKNNLKIIEDCAESLGVKYKNRSVGTIGDIAAFSFYSNKTITCGEGGMVVTNSKKIFLNVRSLKNLGYGEINKFQHKLIGYNYRMSNINAALGLGQLERINHIIKEKKRIYNRYKKNLNLIKGIKIPKVEKHTTKFIMWVFNVYLDNSLQIKRKDLIKQLYKKKIETRESFIPVNYQNTLIRKFKNLRRNNCPNANYIMRNGFYLPSGNTMTNKDIDYVCNTIKKIIKNIKSY